MRYPFKDQAKSSSETLIPVDLSPPMSTIWEKFYPIQKEKETAATQEIVSSGNQLYGRLEASGGTPTSR